MKTVGDVLDLDFEVKVVRPGASPPQPELVRFADLVTGPTVVSVYMRNNTGSCDRQVDTLVAAAEEIGAAGWAVIGLSRDTAGSHGRFAAKHAVPFPLVSDPQDRFAAAADAIVEKRMYGRTFEGPLRSAWLLAADGTVRGVIERLDTKAHGEQVCAALAELG